ncbi:MAG: hypothetical protein ABI550_08615, partial [Ignavibacteriaceae bacterium]
ITDGKGAKFFDQPLRDVNGNEAKWDVGLRDEPFLDSNGNGIYDASETYTDINLNGKWDANIEDWWKGYSPVDYQGRGIKYFLGNNSGLVHSFVDSNNVINGQTYYYSVVAYDHGDSVGIPPTETTKKITEDPISSELQFDENTVQVIPGPRASGYIQPPGDFNIIHDEGIGTGSVIVNTINDLSILDGGEYKIIFSDTLSFEVKIRAEVNYSILRLNPHSQTFKLFDTNFTKLDFSFIANDEAFVVKNQNGNILTKGQDYIINYERGIIRATSNLMQNNDEVFSITYRYYPVYESTYMNYEDGNSFFDGVSVRVIGKPELNIDSLNTKWIEGNTNFKIFVQKGAIGAGSKFPADYEITFSSANIDSALVLVTGGTKKVPVRYSVKNVTKNVPTPILTFLNEKPATKDNQWSPGEEIILFKPGSTGNPNETTWGIILSPPDDSTVTPIVPTDGDILSIKTNRPFTGEDEYSFTTQGSHVSVEKAKSGLDNIYVVPNPYVGVNEIEPTTKLPGQTRGERRIYFENLPQKCTIRIFTLSGELVATLNHESTVENGREFWNLLNRDGFGIAYGVYFAHIDAKELGEKLIKFALIK